MNITPQLLLNFLIAGVMIGTLYALMAMGITFIYSIMKMINWSMGEFYMIGSYTQWFLISFLLGVQLYTFESPRHNTRQFLGSKGFGYVIECSKFDRLHGCLERGIPRDHYDLDFGPFLLDCFQ